LMRKMQFSRGNQRNLPCRPRKRAETTESKDLCYVQRFGWFENVAVGMKVSDAGHFGRRGNARVAVKKPGTKSVRAEGRITSRYF